MLYFLNLLGVKMIKMLLSERLMSTNISRLNIDNNTFLWNPEEEIYRWSIENNISYYIKEFEAFKWYIVFEKENDAVLFKLIWY